MSNVTRSLIDIPDQDSSSTISQIVTGFDTTQEYTISYYWALTDDQTLYDSTCYITTTANRQVLDFMDTQRVPAYTYYQRTIVFQPSDSELELAFTFDCGRGDYFGSAQFIADDFTVEAPCVTLPTCSLVGPPTSGVSCGVVGVAGNSSSEIGTANATSLATCAEICSATSYCDSFSYDGPAANATCTMFAAPIEDLDFSAVDDGDPFYYLACFRCDAQLSSPASPTTTQHASTTTTSTSSSTASTTHSTVPPSPTPPLARK